VYTAFYKLNDHPFRMTPDPSYIYMTAQHREALAGLVYSACTRPGLSTLIGEAGTGKTMILFTLNGLLEKRRVITAVCNNPTLTREEFYDTLLLKFGVDCPSTLKSRQLVALQDTFARNRVAGRPCVLIIDEAHRLSYELLEEVRLLLNIETPREKLLEIILAGQPELAEILARPEMRQLKQRVSCVCKLEPLSPAAVREYIQHRLTKAGRSAAGPFTDDAIETVCQCTHRIPRLVNSLCNASLQMGFALQSAEIGSAIVLEAANDLDLSPNDAVRDIFDDLEPSMHVAAAVGSDGNANGYNAAASDHVPLESYAARQKSLSFFNSLMDRWK
jgi:general secretion pathway protein A